MASYRKLDDGGIEVLTPNGWTRTAVNEGTLLNNGIEPVPEGPDLRTAQAPPAQAPGSGMTFDGGPAGPPGVGSTEVATDEEVLAMRARAAAGGAPGGPAPGAPGAPGGLVPITFGPAARAVHPAHQAAVDNTNPALMLDAGGKPNPEAAAEYARLRRGTPGVTVMTAPEAIKKDAINVTQGKDVARAQDITATVHRGTTDRAREGGEGVSAAHLAAANMLDAQALRQREELDMDIQERALQDRMLDAQRRLVVQRRGEAKAKADGYDPNLIFREAGTFGLVLGGIALLLGGVQEAATGKNTAMEMINRAIDQNIDKQKLIIEAGYKQADAAALDLKESSELWGSPEAAAREQKIRALEVVKLQLQSMGERAGSAQARANANAAINQIELQIADHWSKLDLMSQDNVVNQYRRHEARYATVGGSRGMSTEDAKFFLALKHGFDPKNPAGGAAGGAGKGMEWKQRVATDIRGRRLDNLVDVDGTGLTGGYASSAQEAMALREATGAYREIDSLQSKILAIQERALKNPGPIGLVKARSQLLSLKAAYIGTEKARSKLGTLDAGVERFFDGLLGNPALIINRPLTQNRINELRTLNRNHLRQLYTTQVYADPYGTEPALAPEPPMEILEAP